MLGEILFLFVLIKLILVFYRRKYMDYCFEKAWNGDWFVAFVGMCIGGFLTGYSYFGHQIEAFVMIFAYASLYYWYVKKDFIFEEVITPVYIISFVIFTAFVVNVIYPTIYGISI